MPRRVEACRCGVRRPSLDPVPSSKGPEPSSSSPPGRRSGVLLVMGLLAIWFSPEIIRAVGETGIVVVDEAYGPFARTSFMHRLPEFENMVVMRTVSKLGLAGIRLGYMSAAPALLEQFEKVRPPYNVNVLTQIAAEFALDNIDVLNDQATKLIAAREQLSADLAALPGVTVFPSAANFLLVRVPDAAQACSKLLEDKVMVKNVSKMHALLANCIRVTVSTPEENSAFLDAFKASLPTEQRP